MDSIDDYLNPGIPYDVKTKLLEKPDKIKNDEYHPISESRNQKLLGKIVKKTTKKRLKLLSIDQ